MDALCHDGEIVNRKMHQRERVGRIEPRSGGRMQPTAQAVGRKRSECQPQRGEREGRVRHFSRFLRSGLLTTLHDSYSRRGFGWRSAGVPSKPGFGLLGWRA